MSKNSSNRKIPKEMEDTIKLCAGSMGGVGIWGGLVGAGADLPAIGITWVGMTVKLADQAGHTMNRQVAKKIALAVATGIGSFIGGTKAATAILGWATAALTGGLSLFVSVSANVALNTALTYAYGRAVARYFLRTEHIENVEVMVAAILTLMGDDLSSIRNS